MADHTKIEWTDATWNVITGCSVLSPGCKHCYAMKLAGTRLRHHPSRAGLTIDTAAGPVWNGHVRFNEGWLDQPLRWHRPRRVFVCAHGDLFHEGVPNEWLDRVFAVMALAPQHTFQVLTKRPARMLAYLASAEMNVRDDIKYDPAAETMVWPLPNVWLGVSVENQATADERIPLLLKAPAAVRWISAEPLLGPIDLRFTNGLVNGCDAADYLLDWVVVGGESGLNARPMHPAWPRGLRDQCKTDDVPFLFKQWGEWAPHQAVAGGDEGGDLRRDHVRYLQGDGREPDGHFRKSDAAVARVGKKAAGRLLDGIEHDGYPVG